MAKQQRIRERDVQGVRQLHQLRPLLERLHGVGCERDKAGNRTLHMDPILFGTCFAPQILGLAPWRLVGHFRVHGQAAANP